MLIFFAWRIVLFAPLFFGEIFLAPRSGYPYTLLSYFTEKSSHINHFLLSAWGNFDAAYYLLIAKAGYTVNAGFFPLFPLTIHIGSLLLGADSAMNIAQYSVAFFLVTLYSIIGLIFFYKLVRLDYPEKIAVLSVVFFLVFPTSFFLVSFYSESLFFLLSILMFYYARKKNWMLASIFAGLLSATRIVGIFGFLALLFEFSYQENIPRIFRKIGKNEAISLLKKSAVLLIAPLGLISYIVYNFFKWNDAFYFIHAQGNFQNNRSTTEIILSPQTLYRYVNILTTVSSQQYEWWVAVLELGAFVFASIFLYIGWKQKIRTSYLAFSLLCFLAPTLSGTFTGLPRYVLILFPMYMSIALLKNKYIQIVYAVTGAALLCVLLMLFSKGYYVS